MDYSPQLKRVLAKDHPYGEQIARGRWLWVAIDRESGKVIASGHSKAAAGRAYHSIREAEYQKMLTSTGKMDQRDALRQLPRSLKH